jgi:hypothetical protein
MGVGDCSVDEPPKDWQEFAPTVTPLDIPAIVAVNTTVDGSEQNGRHCHVTRGATTNGENVTVTEPELGLWATFAGLPSPGRVIDAVAATVTVHVWPGLLGRSDTSKAPLPAPRSTKLGPTRNPQPVATAAAGDGVPAMSTSGRAASNTVATRHRRFT